MDLFYMKIKELDYFNYLYSDNQNQQYLKDVIQVSLTVSIVSKGKVRIM